MKAEITRKSSYTIEFRYESESQILKKDYDDMLGSLQAQCHYHPNGYGYPSKVKEQMEGNKFIYTWECSGTCD